MASNNLIVFVVCFSVFSAWTLGLHTMLVLKLASYAQVNYWCRTTMFQNRNKMKRGKSESSFTDYGRY